ncbi:MAG TPA: nucleotide-binding enzyme [Polyangiaceae bacterium]|nr:nucleotide-binding enzyme [Polyangiaceae bacterium]
MSWERHGGLRAAIAQLAAQIMYGEHVKQFFTAKRLAAKRLLGRTGARNARYRLRDLPSNGEIKDALLELVLEIEGESHETRLFAMRILALEAMDALLELRPRLIGSVATGHVRDGSDVDIHVFADHPDEVSSRVRALGWTFEQTTVNIIKQGKPQTFEHLHVADLFPIELTIYAPRELRIRPRSSIDGKPIVWLTLSALRTRLAVDHPERWQRYLASGEVPTLDEILVGDEETHALPPHLELDD